MKLVKKKDNKMKTEDKVIEFNKLVDTINNRLGLEGLDYLCENKIKDLSDFDSFFEYLVNNNYTTVEVIYHYIAIDYLAKNDKSLEESIGIALEHGLSLENINSELLASLLASRKLEELLHEYQDEINEILGDCE
jgi:hypothetical protein